MKKNIIKILLIILFIPFSVNANLKITETINIDSKGTYQFLDINIPFFWTNGLKKYEYENMSNFGIRRMKIRKNEFIPTLNYNENGEIGKKIEVNKLPEILEYLQTKLGEEKLEKMIEEKFLEIVGTEVKKTEFYKNGLKYYFESEKDEKTKIESNIKIEQKINIENYGEEKDITIKISPFYKDVFVDRRNDDYLQYNNPSLVIYDNAFFYQNLKLIINGIEYNGEKKYIMQNFHNEKSGEEITSIIPYYEYSIHFEENERTDLNISYDLPNYSSALLDFVIHDFDYAAVPFRFRGLDGERDWLIHLQNFGRYIIER